MARYRILKIGVYDQDYGRRVLPQSGDLWAEYQAWLKAGNRPDVYVPVPPAAETLAHAKTRKIRQFKAEGLALIKARMPGIESFDMLKLVREMMLSIAAAARQPTTDLTWLQNMWTTGENLVADINACSTVAQVDAVTVSWPT